MRKDVMQKPDITVSSAPSRSEVSNIAEVSKWLAYILAVLLCIKSSNQVVQADGHKARIRQELIIAGLTNSAILDQETERILEEAQLDANETARVLAKLLPGMPGLFVLLAGRRRS